MKPIHAILLFSTIAIAQPVLAETRKASPSESSQIAWIQAMDAAWAWFEDKHDAAGIERFLDDTYVFVGSDGELVDRAHYLAAVAGSHGTSTQAVTSDVVHLHQDTAISVGVIVVTKKDGTRHSTYSYTNVFVWRAGAWKAISTHVSQMPL